MIETNGKFALSCEQVESIVLDSYSDGAVDTAQQSAALAHVSHCSRCAALQESWEAARQELRELAAETAEAQAPRRVEMRVMQEFRTQHRQVTVRRTKFVAAWALAAAAALIAGVAWWTAHNTARQQTGTPNLSATAPKNSVPAAPELIAEASSTEDSGEFIPLPGALAGDTDEGAILRVRMQRGALGALGFPVNEQRAGEWIQVDLLVGNDGSPEAVRLAQEEN